VPEGDESSIGRAFGAENRARLLTQFLAERNPIDPEAAWRAVYELLLWTDRSIGLAHCYESDKCQPGRPWYARSLAFHHWLAGQFGVDPVLLGESIDWLFRHAILDYAALDAGEQLAKASTQREPYAGVGMPVPGEDLGLASVIAEALHDYLPTEPPPEVWRGLSEALAAHLKQDNKRKNLLGEGFEDTLAALIRQIPPAGGGWVVRTRVLLGDIPGFNPQGEEEKQKRVDLVLCDTGARRRVLVTAKWSVRADREEQFGTDFEAYARANAGPPFDHFLITNEFDAARLKAACTRVVMNAHLFTAVVHVNPAGLLQVYPEPRRHSASALPELLASERLVSLSAWLSALFAST
jgi:hypothetical protein